MPVTLALDFGSTGLKAAVLKGARLRSPIARAKYPTRYHGPEAEINPNDILKAFVSVCHQLQPQLHQADVLALSVMSPVLVVLGKNGRPLTHLITHQDRRATTAARRLAKQFGDDHYRSIVGNLSVPGGITATTLAHILSQHPKPWRNQITLVAHLNTFLHHHLTGHRVIDPGNASFTGLFDTCGNQTWHNPFVQASGLGLSVLPEVRDGCHVLPISPASSLAKAAGLVPGMPVTVGLVDTSAACLVRPLQTGDILNISGGTDVLAIIARQPQPAPWHITRCLGTAGLFLHAATIPAAGTAIDWMRRELFADVSDAAFSRLLTTVRPAPGVQCEPFFAGSRTSIDQPTASFSGLTLGTTRQQLLAALLAELATESAARFTFLPGTLPAGKRTIVASGGTAGSIGKVLRRHWPPGFRLRLYEEATLRGLGNLATL